MKKLLVLLAAALCACLANPGLQAQTPYRILVTNDDGVRAPGILAVAQALRAVGDVTVIAPAENQSAKSHSLSITDPIFADQVQIADGLSAWALAATPASCVQVALLALMPQKPNLVVSGINRGYNAGMVAYISGTVGGAREAALQGIPAIASALDEAGHPNYAAAVEFTMRVAQMVKARGLERGVFLNVNVPAGPREAIKGIRLTTESAQAGTQRFEERKTPAGRRYFWNVYQDPRDKVEGTDVWATAQGYVAITPMRIGEFDRRTFDAWKDLLK